MAVIHLEDVRYTYPEAARPSLDGVNLMVSTGERVVLAGVSGSGKSTLLRVVNGLVPHFYGGRFGGRASVAGVDTRNSSPQGLAANVGTVFQDLPARFLTNTIEDEIAFSMEVARVDPRQMPARVAEIAERMGVAALANRRLDQLSAGEQARLAIAAAAARQPRVLLLDEPVTHIDPAGAMAVVEWVRQLSHQEGMTVIVAEHRLEAWHEVMDRLVRLRPNGVVASDGPIFEDHGEGAELGEIEMLGTPAKLRVRDLRLNFGTVKVLQGIDLDVGPGEWLALVGRNGSGKTTLLRCLIGLTRPHGGEISVRGRSIVGRPVGETARTIGYVPQAPSSMLFADSVEDEITLTLRNRGYASSPGAVGPWLEAFGLSSLAARYPRDLSAGERQRVALAAVLSGRPSIVLLDEPTLGMDRWRMGWLGRSLERLRQAGCAIVVATHDAAFVAEYASRAVLLAAGRIAADGDPTAVLRADPAFAAALTRWRATRDAGEPRVMEVQPMGNPDADD